MVCYSSACSSHIESATSSADVTIARELTIDAAQAARSSSRTTKSMSTPQIKKLLDSRNDRDILDGLRRVISVGSPEAMSSLVCTRPTTSLVALWEIVLT